MSDGTGASSRLLLYTTLISVGINVFMLGFVAARLPFYGEHEFHHPHPEHWDHAGGPEGFHDGPGGHGDFGGPGGPGGPHHGPGGHGPGGLDMPPAPFVGGALFTPEEMDADKSFMDEHFQKIRELRNAFAEQLKSGNLTPDMIKEQFAKTDTLMNEIHEHMAQKAIAKITAMTPEQRKSLAEQLEYEP